MRSFNPLRTCPVGIGRLHPAGPAGPSPPGLDHRAGVDTTTGSAHFLLAMLESLKPRSGKRWPRGQKFGLSAAGAVAEKGHREAVQLARAQGRAALDAAQTTWAAPLNVLPGDGIVLSEFASGGRMGIGDVARALEDCGITAAEVKSAVDRLAEAGLIEPSGTAAAAA